MFLGKNLRYRSPFRFAERTYWNIRSHGLLPDRFLKGGHGVIHVGANRGQERFLYARYGLKVAWVEPIPDIFMELQSNLTGFPDQMAYNALIAAQDGTKYQFHISDNEGSSSSILESNKQHNDSWMGKIRYPRSIELEALSLPTFIRTNGIDLASFDMLVLDAEGAELLILEGAKEILPHFRYIQCEAVNFEVYSGCCKLQDLDAYMSKQRFKQTGRFILHRAPKGGRQWDVLYERI
ncbi:MAG TPA: FkbM family methyltransferase [Acidobacteriaceae bacterium]|nr:FkbM family methyltransferase [Acidobacteriaceae bacterium]